MWNRRCGGGAGGAVRPCSGGAWQQRPAGCPKLESSRRDTTCDYPGNTKPKNDEPPEG